MKRQARSTDRFRIATVKHPESGHPIRFHTFTGDRWIWALTVDDRSTDDDVYLPYVYNRPSPNRSLGVRQELVVDRFAERKSLRFHSHREACRALAKILEGVTR